MIDPITQERWLEAQAAEKSVVSYDRDNSAYAYGCIFDYLGMSALGHQGKRILEIGGGAFPAVSYCVNVHGIVVEPLRFESLSQMAIQRLIEWVSEPFEDVEIQPVDEVWLFNVLQHVRDPELVITKTKETADVIRFFEPVDYPTCVYHPHTFTQDDFERWFGDSVKRYTDRLPGFFDDDCCYGTWRSAWQT